MNSNLNVELSNTVEFLKEFVESSIRVNDVSTSSSCRISFLQQIMLILPRQIMTSRQA